MENYYVVKKGHQPGIYKTWLECKKAVDGFKNPIYKKFSSFDEANTFFKSEIINKYVSRDTSKDTSGNVNKIILGNSIKTVSTPGLLEEMHKIKESCKNIKSAAYSDNLNYNVNSWNCISDTTNDCTSNDIYIFTDGSSRKSKGKDNKELNDYNSGIGVYLGYQCINIKEQYNNKTNNQCELMALDYAFKLIVRYYRELMIIGKVINIVSDSEYSIKACSVWLNQWKKNNWMTRSGEPVKNKELIESIDSSMARIKFINSNINNINNSNNSNNSNKNNKNNKIIVKLLHVNSHQNPDMQNQYKFNIWFGNYVADALAQNILIKNKN
jgi:ribonuclease HI